MSFLIVSALWSLAVAGDPWGRPGHLRAVPLPVEAWDTRDGARPVRIFWDGDAPATIAVLRGHRWQVLSEQARPGFTTPPLAPDASLRVRLASGARWSPILAVDPVDDPVSTGVLGGWGGGDVVGQIALDRSTGDVFASTVGGGLLVRRARAQPLAGAAPTVGQWMVVGRSAGLPDVRVVSVDARDGVVLVGTAKGLAVMRDGAVEEVVDTELADPWVQSVLVGDDGSWWAGTYQGLSVRRPGDAEFRTILAPWSVFSLTNARHGGVWAGYEGLQLVGPDESVTAWLADVHVYGITDTPQGPVVATTEAGVLHVAAPHSAQSLSRVVDGDAWGVAAGPGGLWTAAGQLGLVDPEGGMWGRGVGLPSDGVRSVLAMPDQSLFVGTDRGLARVVPREGAPTVDARMAGGWPASTSVSSVLVRPDGLWVAGPSGLQVAGKPHPLARDLRVAAGAANHSIVGDDAGNVWAVGERVVRLNRNGGLDAWWLPATVSTAAHQPGAGLYVGGSDGLWRLDTDRERFVPISTLRGIRDLAGSARGLWVIADQTLFRVVGSGLVPYLQTGVPTCVAEAPAGAWVGTVDGLERLVLDGEDSHVVDVLGSQDAGVSITAVASDPHGVWFGTEGGQVGRVVDGRVGLMELEAVDPPTILGLTPDGDRVWVATDRGLYRVFLSASSTDGLVSEGGRVPSSP